MPLVSTCQRLQISLSRPVSCHIGASAQPAGIEQAQVTPPGSTMAAQGLGWHSALQASCPRHHCLCFRPALQCRPACRPVRICAHASVESMPRKPRPGEKKGFVEEMRFVAMRLHTKDQAPKEGGQKAAEQPFQKWEPTREGYLRFLVESKLVFKTLEDIVAEASHSEYARFQGTGLERSAALAKDIDWFKQTYGLEAPQVAEDGPGQTYARLLRELAADNPPAFICHFYNVYFAHSAGGRMIGKKVSSMCLDDAELNFYRWDGELSDLLGKVKDQLNEVADSWTEEEKAHCLEETSKSFTYSGALMKAIFS